jgi:hypothetical protein
MRMRVLISAVGLALVVGWILTSAQAPVPEGGLFAVGSCWRTSVSGGTFKVIAVKGDWVEFAPGEWLNTKMMTQVATSKCK